MASTELDPVMELFTSPIFASQAERAAMDGLRSFLHSDIDGLEPLCRQIPDAIRSVLSEFQQYTNTALSDAGLYYGEPGTEKELLLLDWKNRYLEYISLGSSWYMVAFVLRRTGQLPPIHTFLFFSDTRYEAGESECYEGIRLSTDIRNVFSGEFLQMLNH